MPDATAPLLLVVLAGVLLAACGGESPSTGPTRSPAELDRVWTGQGEIIEVKVHDLHCSGCEGLARDAVGVVSGVVSVEANHETDIVRVRLDADTDRYAAIPHIREALHGAGKDIVGEDEIPAE